VKSVRAWAENPMLSLVIFRLMFDNLSQWLQGALVDGNRPPSPPLFTPRSVFDEVPLESRPQLLGRLSMYAMRGHASTKNQASGLHHARRARPGA